MSPDYDFRISCTRKHSFRRLKLLNTAVEEKRYGRLAF
jgi:hypothetical protein